MTRANVLAAAGAAVLAVQLFYWWPQYAFRRDVESLDVPGYYEAGRRVMESRPLYQGAYEKFQTGRAPYVYPPPLAAAILPLTVAGPRVFQGAWYGALFVAFWFYAAALARLAGTDGWRGVLAWGLGLQVMPGTATTMCYGNADIIVWAICAWSLCEGLGALAGVGAMIKIFPGWSLLTKPWRQAVTGGLFAAAIAMIGLGVCGLADWRMWITLMGRVSANGGVAWWLNVSLPRLLGVRLPLPVYVAIMITASLALRALRWPAVAGGLSMVLALWLSPVCWWHYAPVLLMPAAAIARETSAILRVRTWGRGLTAGPEKRLSR